MEIQGDGFRFIGGRYIVDNTSNISTRGFLDIITNNPHNASFQPFARNFANALQDSYTRFHHQQVTQHHWEPAVQRFWHEFMQHRGTRHNMR